MVNIAVFAAFRSFAGARPWLILDFKRVCLACQPREGGKSGNDCGKSGKIAA